MLINNFLYNYFKSLLILYVYVVFFHKKSLILTIFMIIKIIFFIIYHNHKCHNFSMFVSNFYIFLYVTKI